MKQKITVFTPTFNRAYLLPRLYESLCNQTSKDFIWLIIDDGSSDHTKALVSSWLIEGKIAIEYQYKKNGGMHTAHNAAYDLIKTELNVCIDSDDMMPVDAIENIISLWSEKGSSSLAGIIGLDADVNNNIIGTKMPTCINYGSLQELYVRYKAAGDKKVVLRTDIVNQYPRYPEYSDEKLVPLGTLYLMISQDYKSLYTNFILCNVEYQSTGSSNTIFRQYRQSPRGFAYARILGKKYNNSFFENCKNSVHLISSAIFAKDYSFLNKGNKIYLNYLMLPFGIAFNFWVKFKIRK